MKEPKLIFLYVKESPLGLKYLGKTIYNPFKYKGSGLRWSRHIEKHKVKYYDIKTTILYQSYNKKDIRIMGLFYSTWFNVVEDEKWANLAPESGQGSYGFKWSKEQKEIPRAKSLYNQKRKIPLIVLNLNNEVVHKFESTLNASLYFNTTICQIHYDSRAILFNKYIFVRQSEYNSNINYTPVKKSTILQYNLEGNFIKEWHSTHVAGKEMKIERSCIKNVADKNEKLETKKYSYKNSIFIWNNSDIKHKIKVVSYHKSKIKVINVETGTIFESIKEAAVVNNLNYGTLRDYLVGKRKNKTNLKIYETN